MSPVPCAAPPPRNPENVGKVSIGGLYDTCKFRPGQKYAKSRELRSRGEKLWSAAQNDYILIYITGAVRPVKYRTRRISMVYVCTVCGYQYDEKTEQVPFAQLPDDWSCPICGAPKSAFEAAE